MKLFTAYIVQTGEEVCVVARSFEHASEVFVTFWLARTASAPGEFHLNSGAPSAFVDNVGVQIIAQGGAAGVIVQKSSGELFFDREG